MSSPIRVLVALDGGTDRNSVEAVLPVQPGIELAGVAENSSAAGIRSHRTASTRCSWPAGQR